jgi:hypothetical protein
VFSLIGGMEYSMESSSGWFEPLPDLHMNEFHTWGQIRSTNYGCAFILIMWNYEVLQIYLKESPGPKLAEALADALGKALAEALWLSYKMCNQEMVV